jgi:cytochrome P450/NADPH-cytochrome P450 reductase
MAAGSKQYHIPTPAGMPVIGNMLTIDADNPLQSLMELTRANGPIFRLDMMGTPLVIASGHKYVHELCDEARFDKAVRGSLRRIRAIGGDGLFTGETQEKNWPIAHRILLPTFSQRAMVNYFPMMLDIAGQLVMKWERLNQDDQIDVVHDMTALALDTIGVCGFDYRFNSFYRQDYHPFIDALTRTLETCMAQRGLPFEEWVLRKNLAQLKKDVGYMNKLVDDIIRERRKAGPAGQAQKDLLNYMLAGVDKATGESLSDENIRYQINTFLIAGHETTSGLMSFALYYLVNNPDVLAKAYAEVDRVLGRDIAAEPTFQQIGQLTYVQQILKEALRLWPTAPAFGLYPYQDELLCGEYKLKKKTFVTVLTLMLHRDKLVWGERAEEFDPENFSREAEMTRPLNAWKPFGNGQRACIGRQFAMQEATLTLGMILQRFELIDHAKYQLKIKETLSIKPDGFHIQVRPRRDRTRSRLVPGGAVETSAAGAVSAAARPAHGTPLLVLYGSNLGTTEEFAGKIAEAGTLNGFDTTLAPLDEYVGRLPKEGAVAIACASYNGSAPDNAVRFVKWVGEQGPGSLAGVNYTVFGCGNRDWASTYQVVPRLLDEKLEAAGARRIVARGEGDAREDMDSSFDGWFRALWPKVGEALAIPVDLSTSVKAEPLYTVDIVPAPMQATGPDAGFLSMKVAENRELQTKTGPKPSDRSTRHIEVALPDGATYRPGDHLAVQPVNGPSLVSRALTRFGLDANTWLRLSVSEGRRAALPVETPLPLVELLAEAVELQAVATRKQVATLAEHTRCPRTKPKLEALAAEGTPDLYRAEVFAKRKSVLDLLEEFPACELPLGIYLEMLPALAPRYYSISSSPAATPGHAAITVGVVQGPARSGTGTYEGVCSNYLAAMPAGSEVRATIKETKAGFRVPDDASTPMIMVGPGTGLAPFRGFLQERAARKAGGAKLGPAILFFGCRHPQQDFIYRDELEAFARDGICDLHTAFSRHDGEKAYVQDVIARERKQVWALIEQGAHVYVCGDGSRMEPDVKRALVRLYADEKDVDLSVAEAWMEEMAAKDRYVLDVWAGA